MKRWSIIGVALASAALGLAGCGDAAPEDAGRAEPGGPADVSERNGRIAFSRGTSVLAADEEKVTYTVNPDGSDLQQLFEDGQHSSRPQWSPDGTEIHIFCCGDGMAAHIVDPDTGDLRTLPPPEPTVEIFCGGSWSPDGKRLSCSGYGVDDPSLNGIYSIRSSDGGGLTRITSPPGGFDQAGDYSPDGERLVFIRFKDERPVGFFVTNVDGSGLRRLTPPDMILDDSGFAGRWSPAGDQILIVALASEDAHKAIWVVNPDGSDLHQLPITPECGGSVGCYSPSWSPDGSKIVFTRSNADGTSENIYTINADGSGLFQVTDGGGDDDPDWGSAPAA